MRIAASSTDPVSSRYAADRRKTMANGAYRVRDGRAGMTLLEVLLAMAIFLFSLVAVSQLFNLATTQATDIQFESRATRLAQSKLGEYIAGVLSLTSGSSGSFDEELEPEWQWSSSVQAQGSAQNLYLVTVTVSRDVPGKGHIETSLSQFITDPKMKGYIPAPTTIPSITATLQAAAGNSSGTASSGGGGATSGGGGGSTSSGGSSGGSSAKAGGSGGGSMSGASGGKGGGSTGGSSGGARGGGSSGGTSTGGAMGGP